MRLFDNLSGDSNFCDFYSSVIRCISIIYPIVLFHIVVAVYARSSYIYIVLHIELCRQRQAVIHMSQAASDTTTRQTCVRLSACRVRHFFLFFLSYTRQFTLVLWVGLRAFESVHWWTVAGCSYHHHRYSQNTSFIIKELEFAILIKSIKKSMKSIETTQYKSDLIVIYPTVRKNDVFFHLIYYFLILSLVQWKNDALFTYYVYVL